MRVIHILNTDKYSGAENVVINIIKELKNEVDSFYVSLKGPIEKILDEQGIQYIPIKELSISEINRVIKEYKPDIIHAHDFRASITCARSNFKGKIISHIHQTPMFLRTWNLKSLIYYLSISRYYKIIGVTDFIIKQCIFSKKMMPKYETICNCINKEKILEKAKEEEQKKYDIAFLGRLEPVKNPIRFLSIVNNVIKKEPKLRVVIIGDGTLRADCEKYINMNNIAEYVEFRGFVDNPFPIIKNTKIVALTSEWEGIPMSILECGALKKPILNNGVGGLNEIFNEINYLICKSNEEYEDKIEINMKKFFDVDNYNERIKKIYNE